MASPPPSKLESAMERVKQTRQDYVTTKEAAEILRLKPQTLRMWRWSGDGPTYIRLGGAQVRLISSGTGKISSAKNVAASLENFFRRAETGRNARPRNSLHSW